MSIPELLDYAAIGRLLGRAPSTVLVDCTRRPHTLPPAIKLANGSYRWIAATVADWLKAQEKPLDQHPRHHGFRGIGKHGCQKAIEKQTQKRGRPGWQEAEAAKAAGMSVRDFRTAQQQAEQETPRN